ncbi:MAG: hypothetical protein JO001_26070 [Alphaproteobacteria bacterium]|nr:hypothetical protein [Alphaproteobacteria bacterium]
MHPISDKAEVAIDFPDKFYVGGFGRESGFEARCGADGVYLRLTRRAGQKRQVEIHLHYLLFADIIEDLAQSIAAQPPVDAPHREPLAAAVQRLATALDSSAGKSP